MVRLAVILVALTAVTACGTISGAGRDLQSAGRAIERVAN
jgi:predicted small secreted protein